MNAQFSLDDFVFVDSKNISDSHCHYNLEPFAENWQEIWKQAQDHGVKQSLIPGVDVASSQKGATIAAQDKNLWAMAGCHPESIDIDRTETLSQLEAVLQHEKVVGIGEIGLDYFHSSKHDERANQRSWLKAQLQLAKKHKVFASLHVRDREVPEDKTEGNAYWDALAILEEINFQEPFILHCVSGPLSYVKACLDRGAYVSFAGNVTYPNAEQIRNILTIVPKTKILIETDAPFLAPQEFRGQTCQPWMIQKTAQFVQDQTSK